MLLSTLFPSQNLESLAAAGGVSPNGKPEVDRLVAAKDAVRPVKLFINKKSILTKWSSQLEAALTEEQQSVTSLRAQLEERTSELETVRKRLNRDVPVNGLSTEANKSSSPLSPSSKSDLNATKEEIKGLK